MQTITEDKLNLLINHLITKYSPLTLYKLMCYLDNIYNSIFSLEYQISNKLQEYLSNKESSLNKSYFKLFEVKRVYMQPNKRISKKIYKELITLL